MKWNGNETENDCISLDESVYLNPAKQKVKQNKTKCKKLTKKRDVKKITSRFYFFVNRYELSY